MNLEAQITKINNPQTFTNLCNTVFTSKYGESYQVVEGARADEGNDGYIRSEKTMLAMYCPVKPQNKTDNAFMRKIQSDFQKALKLRDEGVFEIERWRFVTPDKLSTKVLKVIIAIGKEHNIDTAHLEATYLSEELYKNQHLLQKIPELYLLTIERDLSEIKKHILSQGESGKTQKSIGKTVVLKPRRSQKTSDEYKEVVRLMHDVSTPENIARLRVISYSTKDDLVKLNALIGLTESFNVTSYNMSDIFDKISNILTWCDEGIELAERLKYNDGIAFFMAKKGYFLSFCYVQKYNELYFSIMMDSRIGLSLTQNVPVRLQEINELEEKFRYYLNKSIDLVYQSKDYSIFPAVLISNGNAAGLRCMAYTATGEAKKADALKALCKKCFLTAKDIYNANNDNAGVANVMFNLANQIRFFGESTEAKMILEKIKQTILKTGTEDLKIKFNMLEQFLQSGGEQ